MRPLTLPLAALTVVGLAFAQHGVPSAAVMSPVRAMPAPAGATSYGNILFPGGTPRSAPPFPVALGGTISGSIPYTGARPGVYPGRGRTTVVPYAVPVFAGGYGYPYSPEAIAQPNVTVVVPQQPTPTVIINNHYAGTEEPKTSVSLEGTGESGGLRVYEGPSRRAETPRADSAQPSRTYVRDDKPNIYLIAMNDRTVKEAIGYWVKGESLHYVTPGAKIHEVPLAQVDREASVKLNEARKLEFDLAN